MALAAGSQLGQYVITSLIGKGGMGEVYRARDSKLKREVAIKVLPAAFSMDAERVSRFQREAEILASLNHPHVAAIYDLAEIGETRFLVLELIEGETLADRLARGAIAADDALHIARQIAEGLEAAHEKGVVHRDLKPGNITIAPDGHVKVLDFGLAKVRETELTSGGLSNSPTMLTLSGDGALLGTVSYMSPEQARGKPVDKRTDIWAFGAVLFEMLTGRQAFPGETVSDAIVSVLSREVDWDALPANVGPRVRDLLRRCLRRDAAQRLRDIGDARIEIVDALSAPRVGVSNASAPSRQPRRALWGAGLVAAGIIAGIVIHAGWRAVRSAPDDGRPSWTGTLIGGPNVATVPRLSPDGKSLAFLAFIDGLTQIGVMNPQSGNWTLLTKDRTHGYVSHVNWSLDATKIYYNRHSDVPVGIYSVPALGGEERLVLENANGGEPLPDGSLLVSRINGNRQVQIYRYWPGDGRLHPLPGVLRNSEAMPVRVLPGGSHAVFLGKSVDQPEADRATHLYLLDLATEKTRRVSTGFGEFANFAAFDSLAVMPDGQSALVVAANGDLTSVVSVDLTASRRERRLIDLQASTGYIDVGPDGSLYIDQVQRPVEVARFSSTGTALERFTVFPNSKSEYGLATRVLYAPDGKTWIANAVGGRRRLFVAGASQATTPAIDTDEETDGPLAPLGDDRAVFVIGSADRRQIAIASLRDGRILRRLESPNAATITALIASADAKTLYYVDSGTIWSVPIDGGQPRKIHNGDGVVLTPDGQHLIVQLIETGGVRWLKVGLDGSGEDTIPVKGDAHFTFVPIGPKAVGPDGRIVLPIAVKDSWFWAPAIFDPKTGTVERIPLPFQADPPSPAWTSDGKIISVVYSLTSSLWRFRPSETPRR